MVSKAQKIRLGIFIFFSSILLIVFIVIIAGKKLIEKRDTYFIDYKGVSVNGLQIGGTVKYYGINIGRVEDISIDPEDVSKVVVEISVKAGTPIKEDVEATLVGVGITGLKQIELSGGSNKAVLLAPSSNIRPGISYFDDITGKAEIIAEKVEVLLTNFAKITNSANQSQLISILNSTDSVLFNFEHLISNINSMIDENKTSVNSIVKNLNYSSQNFVEFTQSANQAMVSVDELINSPDIKNILTKLSTFSDSLSEVGINEIIEEDIVSVLQDLKEAISRADDTFNHIDLTILKGRQDFLDGLERLTETIDYINEFSRQISEDPSILIRSKAK